jgi:chaperonin GroEL (HSP60 family)
LNQIIFELELERENIRIETNWQNAVKQTYGTKRDHKLEHLMKPKVTKDGVTVARSIELNDP